VQFLLVALYKCYAFTITIHDGEEEVRVVGVLLGDCSTVAVLQDCNLQSSAGERTVAAIVGAAVDPNGLRPP